MEAARTMSVEQLVSPAHVVGFQKVPREAQCYSFGTSDTYSRLVTMTKKCSEGATLRASGEKVTAKMALALTDHKLFLGMLYECWQ
jgi:hypothetical protein